MIAVIYGIFRFRIYTSLFQQYYEDQLCWESPSGSKAFDLWITEEFNYAPYNPSRDSVWICQVINWGELSFFKSIL